MTDHLLKEVDNAFKWQRIQQAWQNNKQQIVLIVSLSLIGLIAALFYRQQLQQEAQIQSDALLRSYYQLLEKDEFSLERLEELSGSYAQIAHLLDISSNREGEADVLGATLKRDLELPENSVLLGQYICLLKHFGGTDTGCNPGKYFKDALLETQVITLLEKNDISASYQHVNQTTSSGAAPSNRIGLLKDYLRSHSDEPLQSSTLPANDVHHTQSQP